MGIRTSKMFAPTLDEKLLKKWKIKVKSTARIVNPLLGCGWENFPSPGRETGTAYCLATLAETCIAPCVAQVIKCSGI